MVACGHAGEWEKAVRILDDMERDLVANENFGTDEDRLKFYNTAIHACVTAENMEAATSILPRIANARLKPSASTLNILLKGCNPGDAPDLYADVCAMGVEPDVRTFNTLIQKEALAGNWQRALHWFLQIRLTGQLPNVMSFNKLMYAFGKNGQWQMAHDTLSLMCGEGLEPDIYVYHQVLRACQKGRR